MVKRQKWSKQEDNQLQNLIDPNVVDINWDLVAVSMEGLGYRKNAKQCKDR